MPTTYANRSAPPLTRSLSGASTRTYETANSGFPYCESPTSIHSRDFQSLRADVPIVAVMGSTGVGKSTLIKVATGADEIQIGNTLGSCTQKIQVVQCHNPSRNSDIHFIDTPGFDDTIRTDAEILEAIANWLQETYQAGIKLSGILYLHRITDNRVSGTLLRNLDLFLKLCGSNALSSVRLVTTHWEQLQDIQEGIKNEEELRNNYWKHFLASGSRMMRFEYTCSSAWDIINSLPMVQTPLLIQREVVDQGKSLADTAAGRTLTGWSLQATETLKDFIRRLEYRIRRAKSSSSDNPENGERDKELKETKAMLKALEKQELRPRRHEFAVAIGLPALRAAVEIASRTEELLNMMRDPRQLLVALVDKAGRLIDTICDSGPPVHTYPENVEDAIIEFCRQLTEIEQITKKIISGSELHQDILPLDDYLAILDCDDSIVLALQTLGASTSHFRSHTKTPEELIPEDQSACGGFGQGSENLSSSSKDEEGSSGSNHRLFCPDRCHLLIATISRNADQRRALSCEVSGDDAQLMVDYLDIVSRDVRVLESDERTQVLYLLCKLAKSAQIYPRCYELTGVEHGTEPIAGGGFADVFKGTHKGKFICLKVFRTFQKQDTDHILRTLVQELTIWAHLQHENILPFYGVYLFGATTPRICLVSPWMENGNLRDYLRKHPSTPRLPFISDIVNGLLYLHGLEIVHGDLKAENVLVSDDKRALITDFGVSSIVTATKVAPTASSKGTPRWMAPELLLGDEIKATKNCDIWSFACLCYEVLVGQMPYYQYKDPQVIVAQMRKEIPTRPRVSGTSPRGEMNDRLWSLLTKCWDYTPKSRPSCKAIQDSITRMKIRHRPSTITTETETRSAFWEAMREGHGVEIDYARIEEILLRIPLSSSRYAGSQEEPTGRPSRRENTSNDRPVFIPKAVAKFMKGLR